MRLREPRPNAPPEEWRRYAAQLLLEAEHALQRAIRATNDKVAKTIDGTYASFIRWLERQVNSR